MKIKKILVANRGEIALRIIRSCKEMGIKTVALCPQKGEEKNFLETSFADEFVYLNEKGVQGYLNGKKLVEIAKKTNCDALHPGYGFLAENWQFAKLCEGNKIIFIGPNWQILKRLEDKLASKKLALSLKISTLPFSRRAIRGKNDLLYWILKIKPPFAIKARRGGGGIGIRVIDGEITFGQLRTTTLSIKRQLKMAFSDDEFFLEKYLPQARHIEFQVLADGRKAVHLGERECSIQRRFQKLLEESPSPAITSKEREIVGRKAVKYMEKLGYRGAGTVEFLMDEKRKFYFLEVNPRIQVEHPVTEAVTGFDLVKEQIKLAQGEKLSFSQKEVSFSGWAIEARINAEDPFKNFQPTPGIVRKYQPPGGGGIFIHTFLKENQKIYPYFDSLIAKIISWGKTREEAISRLKRALSEIEIEGIPTTVPFFKLLLKEKEFLKGNYTTDFVERSGILEKIPPFKEKKKIFSEIFISEKELAKIIYHLYKSLKKESKPFPYQASKWILSERFKIFEE